MSFYAVDPTSAIGKAVGAASAVFGAAMVADGTDIRVFTSNTGCFIAQGAAPTASATVPSTGSTYVGPNQPTLIYGNDGAELAVARDSADGKATLTKIRRP